MEGKTAKFNSRRTLQSYLGLITCTYETQVAYMKEHESLD